MTTIMTMMKRLDIRSAIIGFLAVITFSAFHFLFNSSFNFIILLYLSYPLFFITTCITELLSKSNNAFDSVVKGFATGCYEFLLYLLIYWVGYAVIVKQAWENPMFEYNWILLIIPPILFAILSIVPTNIAGRLIIYMLRKRSKKSL